MIDHLTLVVSNVARARAFYERALAPLGYAVQKEFEGYAGFGERGKPSFWIKEGPLPQAPMHIAFVAHDRAQVDAFYAAAIAAGGRDDGGPGLRLHYHPNYYAAFVLDPEGHPVEAVCHQAPAAARPKARRAARRSKAKKPSKAKRRGAAPKPRRRRVKR